MMRKRKGKLFKVLAAVMVLTTLLPMAVFAAETTDYVPSMHATFWALIPPVVAIVLALITKKRFIVPSFIGILVGALFYSGFSFEGTITHIFQDGFIAVLSDGNNVGIIISL